MGLLLSCMAQRSRSIFSPSRAHSRWHSTANACVVGASKLAKQSRSWHPSFVADTSKRLVCRLPAIRTFKTAIASKDAGQAMFRNSSGLRCETASGNAAFGRSHKVEDTPPADRNIPVQPGKTAIRERLYGDDSEWECLDLDHVCLLNLHGYQKMPRALHTIIR